MHHLGGDDDDDFDAEFETLDFAKDALSRISAIALSLGVRKKSCDAGCLAAQLWIARKTLDSADSSQLPKLQRRLPKLIDDLERVCAWPESPDPNHYILRSVLQQGTYRSLQAAEDRVKKGILAFSSASAASKRAQYFKKLDRFSRSVLAAEDDGKRNNKASDIAVADEYPPHVNARLYAVLRAHSLCTCAAGCASAKRHHARLKLRDDIVRVDGYVAFDMLFSASPTAWDYWQDLQLRVSLREKAKKAVRYVDDSGSKEADNTSTIAAVPPKERFKVIPQGSFCSLVQAKLGSRICCRVQDSELHQLYDGFPVVQQVDPGPSLSLRQVLTTRRLSNRMKLVLAYIVSRSFWQYYDSPWMESQWTSDSVHFLAEHVDDEDEGQGSGALFASKPYLAVEFDGQDGGDSMMEYYDAFSVIFRYPRLLALCMMLLEIGRGQSLVVEDQGSMVANLNTTWSLGKRLAGSSKSWGDFDYPDYRKAVLGCLNYTPTDNNEQQLQLETDVQTRKAAIYKIIVEPLERLLKLLGFSDNLHIMDPIDSSRGPGQMLSMPAVPSLSIPMQDRESAKSSQWLDKINIINAFIHKTSLSKSDGKPRQPVRIAVLDTGFDEATFFTVAARRRKIKGWKDWVDGSEEPVDENGHGTHTLALVMKVAPTADIYVARIAKDKGSLKNAAESIAEAIDWAANVARADIVSMSFGFQDEIPVISRAIHEAELSRENKILFFAAASNSGGNRREMFPANLDSVISIRETNSNGAFSDSNPPVDPSGPVVFGTVGREVPSAWLRTIDGEIPKSGSSVATAVAAGIGAMMLGFVNVGLASPEVQLPPEVGRIWSRRGMLSVLKRMSQDMGNRSYYISPVSFFTGKDASKSWSAIADACVG